MMGVSRGGGVTCSDINKKRRGQTLNVPFSSLLDLQDKHTTETFSMKAFTEAESPRQRTIRRFSKPVMEKRRRERINHSLETLRLLMLDNTNNEKLKNPKVEKAEILESVVHFLKTEREVERGHRPMKKVQSRDQRPTSARQYHDGMRSCLLRVSHFITSQEEEGTKGDTVQASHPSSPEYIHSPQGLSPQPLPHHRPQHRLSHPYLSPCDTRLLSSMHIPDPVWRPWPQ